MEKSSECNIKDEEKVSNQAPKRDDGEDKFIFRMFHIGQIMISTPLTFNEK